MCGHVCRHMYTHVHTHAHAHVHTGCFLGARAAELPRLGAPLEARPHHRRRSVGFLFDRLASAEGARWDPGTSSRELPGEVGVFFKKTIRKRAAPGVSLSGMLRVVSHV